LICLGVVLIGIGGHTIIASPRGKGPIWLTLKGFVWAIWAIPTLIPGKDRSIVTWLARLAGLAAVGSIAVLFLTGFGPAVMGLRLSGYLLMIHVTFGPVLAVSLAFLVLVRAKTHVPVRANAAPILALLRLPVQPPLAPGELGLVAKGCFWALAVLALPLTLSIVLSMFPLFGTEGQKWMAEVHRYCALAFSLSALMYGYIAIRRRVVRT
jgi:hypothetical protein